MTVDPQRLAVWATRRPRVALIDPNQLLPGAPLSLAVRVIVAVSLLSLLLLLLML